MERTPAKRSSLFLLELMIAILFFCLASAVCVQIFVKAHTTSRETQELNTALEKVSGYTELFLADALTEDTEVFYDADWQECSKDEASYEIVIRQRYDEKDYVTYLYAYDGYLRELFVRDGTEAKASDGRKILATKDFEAKETSDGIFHLYCENEDGKKTDTFVSVKSAAR